MNKAVFLDRDGVINEKPKEGEYITSWGDFHILPGVAEAIALLHGAGYMVVVVTNQRCIAKGLITAAGVEAMHQQMVDSLASAGAVIDAAYYCPHEMEPACDCRKPAPGMLLQAANSLSIELAASWMIGDSDIDVEAGKNASCKTARLVTGDRTNDHAAPDSLKSSQANIIATSLLDAVRRILQIDGVAAGFVTNGFATT